MGNISMIKFDKTCALIVIICIGFALLLLNQSILDIEKANCNIEMAIEAPAQCNWKFLKYVQSEQKLYWMHNIKALQDNVCAESNKDHAIIEDWVHYTTLNLYKKADLSASSSLSKFYFQNNCTGKILTDFIEPLQGLTRHPYYCLKGAEWVVNKDYMILSWNASQKLIEDKSKAYYFDLGASAWDEGAGGASQSWIVTNYERRGIQWDGIFCWEANFIEPSQVWSKIPARFKHIYHWYNIPVSEVRGHPDSALDYILSVAKPEDFVVLKLDIDNLPVETAIIQEILKDDVLASLIDELFFEHHVDVAPMHQYWGVPEMPAKLADTYDIFSTLRNKGILAHSWV